MILTKGRVHPANIILVLMLLALLVIVVALSVGSAGISWSIGQLLFQSQVDDLTSTVLFQLRLPRVIAAFTVGGLLALAGALMQVMLRNPLADPYILGISGGSAVVGFAALLLGFADSGFLPWAFAGSLLSLALVFVLSYHAVYWNPVRLLLTGVMVAAGWNALLSFMLAISPNTQLRGMMFWLMGDLSQPQYPYIGLGVLAFCFVLSWRLAPELNMLRAGDLQAKSLGVNVTRVQIQVYLFASLMTAVAVSIAGSVGFVGLVVPHLLRLCFGSDHRLLLPACVLAGGIFLTIADTGARTLLAPISLPVGVVTALIGVPLFLLLLRKQTL